jgi:hypothetical protein
MGDQLPLIQILRAPPETASVSPDGSPPRPAVQWSAVVERLRQYGAARARRAADEQCEFCGAGVDTEHGHLVDVPRRALLCVCRPCYLLFTHEGSGGSRFRAVPTRFELLPAFAAARERWEAFDIPIGLAFFFRNSETGRTTAFYPSPAGATESELTLGAWDTLVAGVPRLESLASDVEALLVRRTDTDVVALIVPVDACYELVGLIRVLWRGLQGGDGLWRGVDEFFARAVERARSAAA